MGLSTAGRANAKCSCPDMELLKTIVKDVCTIKNGEDYCIAGITGLLGLLIGCGVMVYAVWHFGDDIAKVGDLLVKFGAYLGTLITTVCTGKIVKNNAEPQ